MSTTQKTYKKGEILFRDGDKVQNVIFIQSGGVNQCLIRGKKNVDLFQLGSNQVLGETALIGQPNHPTAAVASSETKTVEVAVDTLKAQYEGAPPIMKMLIKSLIERLKQAVNEVKSSKVATDSTPCPEELIPQLFGAMYFTALHKGEKADKGTQVSVDWQMMRSYSQRVLGQSPKRQEQAINVLVKLKLAHYDMGKLPEDPDGPDVITRVHFHNLGVLEAFFEFYQYYFYKPGKGEILKYDDFACQILETFVAEGEKIAPDRFGIVSVDFNAITALIKEKMSINFNNDHFSRLETKGVLCKRRNIEGQGVKLEFEIREYQNILFTWKIIRELDKWNEKGFVDMDEKEERKAKKSGGPACPECAAELIPQAKFCSECGCKIVAAA
jgi:CRP-like cAMP-binding protein